MNLVAQFETARPWREARPSDSGQFVTEFRAAGSLTEPERERWARLTARSGNMNIFAADWFMASALRNCAGDARVRLAIVRTLDGEWLGVLPLAFAATIGRCPIPAWHNWLAANQFDATPLIERGNEHIFWHCLLTQLDRRPLYALALCCDQLPLDDPATHALIDVCLAQGRRFFPTDRMTRPMRGGGTPDEADLAARRKLDKRLDSLERKLAREVGVPRFVSLAAEADPGEWIENFLALERLGWKGSRASALDCQRGTARLFREVIRIAHQKGAARLMTLEVDGRPLAMTSWFVCGERGYGFKMAYDESFRSFAPGRLLMRAVACQASAEPVLLFDSCAGRDAPPDPLWPQQRELVSYAVSIGSPLRRAALEGAMRIKAIRDRRSAGQSF